MMCSARRAVDKRCRVCGRILVAANWERPSCCGERMIRDSPQVKSMAERSAYRLQREAVEAFREAAAKAVESGSGVCRVARASGGEAVDQEVSFGADRAAASIIRCLSWPLEKPDGPD